VPQALLMGKGLTQTTSASHCSTSVVV
jgi:hypothetical protein